MKILKTMISLEGEGKIYKCDTIQFEGKFWIVSKWLDMPGTERRTPERLILLDILPHQKTTFGGCDFLLKYPMPKSVFFDGKIPPEIAGQYVVLEKPHIYLGSDSIQ